MVYDQDIKEGVHLVDINEIVSGSGPFCMSFGFDLAPLIRSIKRVGLINNPLLVEKDRHGFDIVAGFRRILALKSLGWKVIPCRILSGASMSPLECLLLGLHENLCIRNFNDVEKGMILKRLSLLVDKDDILDHYMPLINLPSHEPVLSLYLRVENELEDEIKTSLCVNKLSLHAAKLLLGLEQDERCGIVNLLEELIFNVNQQKQLIGYLEDIKQLRDVKILDILEDQAIRIIRYDNNLNNPQKVNAILKVLRAKIFPRLNESEESFKKILSRLNLPEGVKVVPSPYFESPDYQMVVQFRDGTELQEKIVRLSNNKDIRDIRDPWENNS
jgi:ParB family chromosome partitioning protein